MHRPTYINKINTHVFAFVRACARARVRSLPADVSYSRTLSAIALTTRGLDRTIPLCSEGATSAACRRSRLPNRKLIGLRQRATSPVDTSACDPRQTTAVGTVAEKDHSCTSRKLLRKATMRRTKLGCEERITSSFTFSLHTSHPIVSHRSSHPSFV